MHDFKVGDKVVIPKAPPESNHWSSWIQEIVGLPCVVDNIEGASYKGTLTVHVKVISLDGCYAWVSDQWIEHVTEPREFKVGDKVICERAPTVDEQKASACTYIHDGIMYMSKQLGKVGIIKSLCADGKRCTIDFHDGSVPTTWGLAWLKHAKVVDYLSTVAPKHEFKVGDKVVCERRPTEEETKQNDAYCGFVDGRNRAAFDMCKGIGVTGTITKIDEDGLRAYIKFPNDEVPETTWFLSWLKKATDSSTVNSQPTPVKKPKPAKKRSFKIGDVVTACDNENLHNTDVRRHLGSGRMGTVVGVYSAAGVIADDTISVMIGDPNGSNHTFGVYAKRLKLVEVAQPDPPAPVEKPVPVESPVQPKKIPTVDDGASITQPESTQRHGWVVGFSGPALADMPLPIVHKELSFGSREVESAARVYVPKAEVGEDDATFHPGSVRNRSADAEAEKLIEEYQNGLQRYLALSNMSSVPVSQVKGVPMIRRFVFLALSVWALGTVYNYDSQLSTITAKEKRPATGIEKAGAGLVAATWPLQETNWNGFKDIGVSMPRLDLDLTNPWNWLRGEILLAYIAIVPTLRRFWTKERITAYNLARNRSIEHNERERAKYSAAAKPVQIAGLVNVRPPFWVAVSASVLGAPVTMPLYAAYDRVTYGKV